MAHLWRLAWFRRLALEMGGLLLTALVLLAAEFLLPSPLAAFLLGFALGPLVGYALTFGTFGRAYFAYPWWSLVALGFVLVWDYILPYFYPVQPLVRSTDPVGAAMVGLVLGGSIVVLRRNPGREFGL